MPAARSSMTVKSFTGDQVDTGTLLKKNVSLFKDFSTDRIKELVDGSTVRSFEANEAIAHQGAEARLLGRSSAPQASRHQSQ